MLLIAAAILLLLVGSGHGVGVLIGNLPTIAHGVRGKLYFNSPTQIRLSEFDYDGQGPDAFLYYYRPGERRRDEGGGIIIPLPDEFARGSEKKFDSRRLTNADITVDLPGGTTICDIGIFTIWCRRATAFFTFITIPSRFSTRAESGCVLNDPDETTPPPDITNTYGNCEFLSPKLEFHWTLDAGLLHAQLCGCRPTANDMGEIRNGYMGFGFSGNLTRTWMVDADAVIAWVDVATGAPNAVDYYLTSRTPCVDGMGVCPDTVISGQSCTNNVVNISGSQNSQRQCVQFTRPLEATDSCDVSGDGTGDQYIVWAIGGIETTAFRHFTSATLSTPPLQLGRTPVNNCTSSRLSCETCPPFRGSRLPFPRSTTFSLRIGPAAAERGYQAITGQVGWGITWYVNGSLIPELVLSKGVTYTFIVEGGNDTSNLARYHPFYITNSSSGGILRFAEENPNEVVYAGINEAGEPTGVGRYCELTETERALAARETCMDQDTYEGLLETNCDENGKRPGILTWTPDDSTPGVVYYQCATHKNLGWRITISGAPALMSSATVMVLSLLLFVELLLA